MSDFVANQEEFGRSLDFFMDPASYERFSMGRNLLRIIGCIDPRDQESTRLRTVVQTAGGAVGEALDVALALTVESGELTTLEQGLYAERSIRHAAKLCAHRECKFIGGLPTILGEMANPTDFTHESMDRWSIYYELGDMLTRGKQRKIQDAAKQQLEVVPREADILEVVDRLYSDETNVANMSGKNRARIYVVNHHPNAGLNRHKKHRESGLTVQGYHDSLGATISDRMGSRVPASQRELQLSAHILRAAAVRTVIGTAHDDTHYLEVQMTSNGPSISEVK